MVPVEASKGIEAISTCLFFSTLVVSRFRMLTAIEKASIYGSLLETERIILKPFSMQHLQRYARWLSEDTALCIDTATDAVHSHFDVSFCESMQQDNDKLLFILLDKVKLNSGALESDCMIGDIGCHLVAVEEETAFKEEEHYLEHYQSNSIADPSLAIPHPPASYALELILMIAEPEYRRQGLAIEVATYFIDKVLPTFLPIPSLRFPYFIAKITRVFSQAGGCLKLSWSVR